MQKHIGGQARGRTRPLVVALLGATAAALTATGTANAAPPQQVRSTDTESIDQEAGEFCTVPVRQTITFTSRSTVFGDPEAPDRVIGNYSVVATIKNLETGATVTDTGHFVLRNEGDRLTAVGLGAQVRDPSGKVVSVSAGRTVLEVDTATGEIVEISATGNAGGDYAATVCQALGAGVPG